MITRIFQYEFPKPGTHPDFPFDALVFQGGGAKGTIYFGAVLALEELGILPYIKRFAGASKFVSYFCSHHMFISLNQLPLSLVTTYRCR